MAKVLGLTRLDVAFSAIGNAIGAYEAALIYAKEREQFGKRIEAARWSRPAGQIPGQHHFRCRWLPRWPA